MPAELPPRFLDAIDPEAFTFWELMALAVVENGQPMGPEEVTARIHQVVHPTRLIREGSASAAPLVWTPEGRFRLDSADEAWIPLMRKIGQHLGLGRIEVFTSGDRIPVRPEDLEAAFPPPSRTYNLSGIQVIGLVIEAVGKPLTLREVHDHLRESGLGLDESALQRCAERPNTLLRQVAGDRWDVASDDDAMAVARRRLRRLVRLNAGKQAREERDAAQSQRYWANEAARAAEQARLRCKVSWRGRLVSVQPRILFTRSFDQGDHTYLGYVLRVVGVLDDRDGEFTIGIGKAAQAKHAFRAGDQVSGVSLPVRDPRTEPVEYYKTSGLRLLARAPEDPEPPPPWHGAPPELQVYRERGHRRLDSRVYTSRCASCIWGCRMAVVMIVDHWNPSRKRYRFETFCYGPKNCSFYRAGKTRKVPGRKGMSWEEEDWVDEQATSHREPDE